MSVFYAGFVVVSPAGSTDCVVKAEGEIDLATSVQFRQTLFDVLGGRPRTLTVDMADVEFLDSTGISVLVGVHRAARTMDVQVVIRAPSVAVVRVLELTGLDKVFRIEPVTAAGSAVPSSS
jgi:anti-sigma B factor antagonist